VSVRPFEYWTVASTSPRWIVHGGRVQIARILIGIVPGSALLRASLTMV
jgi:hypothetical protein